MTPDQWRAKVRGAVMKAGADAVEAAAMTLNNGVKDQLNLRSSNKGNGGKGSPVGQPPANRTGTLRRSWTVGKVTTSGTKVSTKIGSNVKYAAIHEFGGMITVPAHTRTTCFGRKTKPYTMPAKWFDMPKRPYIEPAIQKTEDKAIEKATKVFTASLKRGLR